MSLHRLNDKIDESLNRIESVNDTELLRKIKSLTKIRLSTDIELRSIADKTKISMKNLKSIEKLELEKLPSEPWRNSFITQYCNFIENFKSEDH